MNRRVFLTSTGKAAAGLAATSLLNITCAAEATDSTDEALLEQARERIARHRQADLSVIVRDSAGRPLPHIDVSVHQLRHDFLFGCNIFRLHRIADPEREDLYRARFADLFNFATTGFYWSNYERVQGRPDYAYTDSVLDWAESVGIEVKGHPLAWDNPAGNPRWLPDDPATVGRLSLERTAACVRRFRHRLRMWDVVNEPVHLGKANLQTRMSQYARTREAVAYVHEHLAAARQADPAATLLVNDYRLEPRYLEILEALRDDQGQPLCDAVGLQSHMHSNPWPLRKIWDTCDRYAPLDLPLHFTETTIVSGPRLDEGRRWGETTTELERKQADHVERFYTMVFAHPNAAALTWWDFSDDGAWQRAAAGFLRKDMSPKPVYERLHRLIRGEWWTNRIGKTDAEGVFAPQATYGLHRIQVHAPSGKVVERTAGCRVGKPNRVEVVV